MEKIKLAIIEIKDHPVFLEGLLNLFDSNNYLINVYLSNSYLEKFGVDYFFEEKNNINLNFQKEEATTYSFLKNNMNELNKNDIVIFNTPEMKVLPKILKKTNFKAITILNIHNLNTWFNNDNINYYNLYRFISPELQSLELPVELYNYNLICKLIKVLKIVKYIFFESLFYKNKRNLILSKIDVINFLHPNMNNSVKGKFSKKIINLPFRFPKNLYKPKLSSDDEFLSIGIIGNIDQQRRDYLGLLNFLKNFKLNFKLKFVFLGTFHNEEKYKNNILRLTNELETNNLKFDLFSDYNFIDQETFDNKMEKIDIILAPINQFKYNSLYKEEYGVSKATGSDFDAFYYKKPILMPDFYKSIEYLKPLYNFYSDYNELFKLLEYYSDRSNLIKKYTQLNQIYTNLDNFKKTIYKKINSYKS